MQNCWVYSECEIPATNSGFAYRDIASLRFTNRRSYRQTHSQLRHGRLDQRTLTHFTSGSITDLLLHLFRFSCFVFVELTLDLLVSLNPNRSNRRSALQRYFPFQSKWVFSAFILVLGRTIYNLLNLIRNSLHFWNDKVSKMFSAYLRHNESAKYAMTPDHDFGCPQKH